MVYEEMSFLSGFSFSQFEVSVEKIKIKMPPGDSQPDLGRKDRRNRGKINKERIEGK